MNKLQRFSIESERVASRLQFSALIFLFNPISMFIGNVYVNSNRKRSRRYLSQSRIEWQFVFAIMEGCLALILPCNPSFSLLASNKKNSFQILEIKLSLTLKRLETRIYLLMVWNGARNYMQTRWMRIPARWITRRSRETSILILQALLGCETAEMRGDFTKDLHINWCFLFPFAGLRYIGKQHLRNFSEKILHEGT